MKMFRKFDHMCATFDIWTRNNVSFIAVSVHFFVPSSLDLQSRFIACSHFPGTHTAEKITEKLQSIFQQYEILDKVDYITTDSASNYLASLKYHGDNYRSHRMEYAWLNEDDTEFENEPQEPCDDDEKDDYDNDDEFELELNESNDFTSEIIGQLPAPLLGKMNHVKCSAHKTDKLGSKDALEAKNMCPNYAETFDRVHRKMSELWKIRDSRQKSEFFKQQTGKTMLKPHRIRWLGTHDAVSRPKFSFSFLCLALLLFFVLESLQYYSR